MFKIILAAGFALAAATAPAFAKDGSWRVGNDQINIVDSSTDTATPAGRAALLAKVEKAAEKLCRDREGPFRSECETGAVRETAAKSAALTLALRERQEPALAAR